jgi:hypothetical protein
MGVTSEVAHWGLSQDVTDFPQLAHSSLGLIYSEHDALGDRAVKGALPHVDGDTSRKGNLRTLTARGESGRG